MIFPLLLTFALVFYYTYRYTYHNAISLIESLTTSHSMSQSQSESLHLHRQPPYLGQKNDLKKSTTNGLQIRLLSKVVFSLNVTCTVLMIISILAQFIYIDDKFDINDEYYSLWFWNVLLVISVSCLTFIQPVLVFYVYNDVNDRVNTVTWTYTGVYTLFWLALISSFDWISDLTIAYDGVIHTYLQKIGIIGVTLIAFMNGLASISSFYYCLYDFLLGKIYELKNGKRSTIQGDSFGVDHYESVLANLYDRLRSIEENIELKRREEQSLDTATSKILNKRQGFRSKGSIYDLKSFFGGKDQRNGTGAGDLDTEIRTLESIRNDLTIKISKVSVKLDATTNSGLFKYKIKWYTEKIIASYCLIRIIQVALSCCISLFHSSSSTSSTSDPLVVTIVNIISILVTLEEEEIIINQLSFLISGVFFVFSFNGIYILLSHLYKFIPWNHHRITTPVKNLIISELFGVYTLSTFFILKSNLTEKFTEKLDHLLSITSNDSLVIDQWFDKVFLVSVIVIFIGIKINEYWYEFDDDDEYWASDSMRFGGSSKVQ